ncbi:MAG TPA: DUF6132 family protein [Spirochaetota bacterium]|nr:DUF6132 family protein [Spirochaetota bacterium]
MKEDKKNRGGKLLRIGIGIGIGGLLGFSYYYFIGCASGTCPITSSPWISTGYGMLAGGLISAANK